MNVLYTRSGRLLQLVGNHLHSRSGTYLGQLHGNKIFTPEGKYCGTVVGDRVVYRTIDSAATVAASVADAYEPCAQPNRTGSSLWGVDPTFAD